MAVKTKKKKMCCRILGKYRFVDPVREEEALLSIFVLIW